MTAPDIAALLPHRPPMRLLDEVLEHTDDLVRCGCTWPTEQASPFGHAGAVVSLELMAQCAAAHAGLQARAAGSEPRVGYLVSCRRLTLHVEHLEAGRRYLVEARRTAGDQTLYQYEGRVWAAGDEDADQHVADARFAVYLEPDQDTP